MTLTEPPKVKNLCWQYDENFEGVSCWDSETGLEIGRCTLEFLRYADPIVFQIWVEEIVHHAATFEDQ